MNTFGVGQPITGTTANGPETAEQLANPYRAAEDHKHRTEPKSTNERYQGKAEVLLWQWHAKELPHLDIDDLVRVAPTENSNTIEWKPASVVETLEQPRSYTVEFNNKQRLRRNRKHLRRTNNNANRDPELEQEPDTGSDSEYDACEPPNIVNKHSPSVIKIADAPKPVVTSYGRVVKKPDRLDLWTADTDIHKLCANYIYMYICSFNWVDYSKIENYWST